MDLGEAVIDVVLDLREMAVTLKAVKRQVAKELQRAGEMGKAAFAKGLRGIAKVAKWTALGVAGVTAAMAAGAGVALQASNQLNAAMANVASLGSEAAAHVGTWKGELQNLSVQMGKTTDDLAGGLYQVVSAFGATDDTMEVLAINAKAATAGLAQTTDAINLTSAVTKAYGDTSAEAVQQVSDLAMRTVQLGQTTFPELASSIGRVTPLAASMGLSMQDLFAVMATATGVTGSAAEVSTQMRAALQALMAPTDATAKLIKQLGYESGQAMLQSLGFGGAMQAIVEAAEKSGRPLQDFIGQIEGQTLALALADGLSEQYTEKLEAMQHAAGATDEAFRAQTQGIAGVAFQLQQLKQRAVVFLQKVGDAVAPFVNAALGLLVPVLDGVAEKVETVLTAFSDLVTGSRSFAEIHDSLTSVFGDEMGSRIFGFLDGLRQLINGLREGGLMGDRFRDALERVGGSGAVAVFDGIVAAVQRLREWLSNLWQTVGPFINDTVIPFIQEHGPAIAAAIGAIGAALAAAAIVSTIVGIAGAVAALANPVTLILALVGLLAAAWVEDWGGIQEKTAAVIDRLQAGWFIIRAWFTVILPAALDLLEGWFIEKWTTIRQVWDGVKGALLGGFGEVQESMEIKLTNAVDALKTKFGDFAKSLKEDFLVGWEKLREAFEWARENIPGVDKVFQGLKKTFDYLNGYAHDLWKNIQKLAEALGLLHVPSDFQRHSPSPIEMTFMGLREHLRSLATGELPAFSRGLEALGRYSPGQTVFNQQNMSSEQIVIHAPAGLDAEALTNLLYAQRMLRVTELPG